MSERLYIPARAALTGLLLATLAAATQAEEAFSFSGFASAVAGRVVSGSRQDDYFGQRCPCFVADYGHGAVYEPHWSLKQESKVGLQGTYAFNPQLSGTVQVVARGADGIKAGLEWAYLSYDLNPSWTVQVGRKRLPIYYYSDFQDVGYAYTWVRPPADIYGWEVVNYNGLNATYRSDWAGWAVKSNLFAGRESTKDNLYSHLYYDTEQNVTWKNILGGDLVLSKDWLTTRLTYIQSDVQQWDRSTGERVTPAADADHASEKQIIYGISANVDIDNWFVRSEYSVFDRSGYSYLAHAHMLGVGVRLGNFTPMLTHTRYAEQNAFAPDATQRDHGWSATLRYELSSSFALKVQYDEFKDRSGSDFDYVGNSRMLSISVDTVF
jgi:hypothetical protein